MEQGSVPEQMPLESRDVSLPTGELAVAARTLVEERLRGVRRSAPREVAPVDVVLQATRESAREHLFEEACELYWNELSWEQLSDEERVEEGEFTEMVFPGLLAFVDALLPRAPNGEPDRDREHRDVAHDLLLWLAARLVELRNAEPEDVRERQRLRRQASMTDDLIDLVALRLYGLDPEEMEGFGDA